MVFMTLIMIVFKKNEKNLFLSLINFVFVPFLSICYLVSLITGHIWLYCCRVGNVQVCKI